MGRLGMRMAGLGLMVVATAGPSHGFGQGIGEGVINAVSYRSFPVSEPVYVRVLDDSDQNLAIKRQFQAALKTRGYVLTENPTGFVLTIETRRFPGAWSSPPSLIDTPLIDQGGRLSIKGRAEVPRFVGTPAERTDIITPSRYRLDVTIEDRTDSTRVWEGWALANLSEGDPSEFAQAMVSALVDSIGRTVRQQSFKIDESGGRGPS